MNIFVGSKVQDVKSQEAKNTAANKVSKEEEFNIWQKKVEETQKKLQSGELSKEEYQKEVYPELQFSPEAKRLMEEEKNKVNAEQTVAIDMPEEPINGGELPEVVVTPSKKEETAAVNEEPVTTNYIVQNGESPEAIIKKQFKSQGRSIDPKSDEYKQAVADLKELNKDNLKTFRLANGSKQQGFRVGTEIKLNGEVDTSKMGMKSSREAIGSYSKAMQAKEAAKLRAQQEAERAKQQKQQAEQLSEQQKKQAVAELRNGLNQSKASFKKQNDEDGWAGKTANWVKGLWNSDNTTDKVQGVISHKEREIQNLEMARQGKLINKKTGKKITFEEYYKNMTGTDYVAGNSAAGAKKSLTNVNSRVSSYTESQQTGAGWVKTGAKIGGTIAAGAVIVATGGTATPLVLAVAAGTTSLVVDGTDRASNNIDNSQDLYSKDAMYQMGKDAAWDAAATFVGGKGTTALAKGVFSKATGQGIRVAADKTAEMALSRTGQVVGQNAAQSTRQFGQQLLTEGTKQTGSQLVTQTGTNALAQTSGQITSQVASQAAGQTVGQVAGQTAGRTLLNKATTYGVDVTGDVALASARNYSETGEFGVSVESLAFSAVGRGMSLRGGKAKAAAPKETPGAPKAPVETPKAPIEGSRPQARLGQGKAQNSTGSSSANEGGRSQSSSRSNANESTSSNSSSAKSTAANNTTFDDINALSKKSNLSNTELNVLKRLLGITDETALSKDVLKKAFRKKAIELHPDKNPNGEEMMKMVNLANEILLRQAA